MKVCIINNIYPPYDRGGAEQVVVKTVEGLIQAGHQVVVITSSPEGESLELKNSLKIYRNRPRNIFFYTEAHHHGWLSRFFWHFFDTFNISSSTWVREILIKEAPDVVHTHNLMGLSFLIPKTIRSLDLRHVHHVHDVQLVEPSAMILKAKESSWRYNGLPTKVYTWVMKRLMGSPSVVISPSQFLKDFYGSRGFFPHSRFEIVRNPVTFPISSEVRREGEREQGIFNFLYLGQIEYHKGVLLLLKSFVCAVEEQGLAAELHVVGDGSLLDDLKSLAAPYSFVHIYGKKDREAIPDLFRIMDMTVVPSLCYENSPTVIFESFAFGVPVLASNSEGIAELIEEGANGFTFAPGDEKSLEEKIAYCVFNKKEIFGMGTKAKLSLKGLLQGEYVDTLVSLYAT